MKNKKEPVIASSTWFCDTCDDRQAMKHPEMIEHLKIAHNLDSKGLKCKKIHADAP
jgi:hypothetical protein